MDQPISQPTHYEILSLSPSIFSPSSGLSPEEIKQILKKSYRRALLSHHPDKSSNSQSPPAKYTIDQITLAFTTLSTPPSARIETIDLDDLTHEEAVDDEQEDSWHRPCRCGNPKGFLVRESDLEEAADSGIEEVVVGCADCSLWLRVVFGVVVQDFEDDNSTPLEQEQEKEQEQPCQGSAAGRGCCGGGGGC
ncbi:CSL zinc finger-domain-containing protein [Apiosordaria backusii]|uniref:Diphthamide biosynthesis protein 4 n=1 Tax=Apiosordaria backusii TaxID=314023 RepID=A0AA40EYZ5_9PEZI|nr:CSL zinc finger-domain-containing protein [Apiosordaria backusii]